MPLAWQARHEMPLTTSGVPDGLALVADDRDRRGGVEAVVLGVGQHVALEAVGQVEDHLAAGLLERLVVERVAREIAARAGRAAGCPARRWS